MKVILSLPNLCKDSRRWYELAISKPPKMWKNTCLMHPTPIFLPGKSWTVYGVANSQTRLNHETVTTLN